MKTYTIRSGSKFTLMQETPARTLVSLVVADRDFTFDDCELVEIDLVEKTFHFHVGNRHYYTNIGDVTVTK
jgi:hypothetical protein